MSSNQDEFYTQLRNRWEESRRTLEAKTAQIQQLQNEFEDLRGRVKAYAKLLMEEFPQQIDPGELVAMQDLSEMTATEAAMVVLSDDSVPAEGLHAKEIVRRMRERGWRCDAKNPVITVSGSLARSPDFEKTGPNVFCVKP